jgi:hypothetical protein
MAKIQTKAPQDWAQQTSKLSQDTQKSTEQGHIIGMAIVTNPLTYLTIKNSFPASVL